MHLKRVCLAFLPLVLVIQSVYAANSANFDFHINDQSGNTRKQWSGTQSGIRLEVTGNDTLFQSNNGLGVKDGRGSQLDAKDGEDDFLTFEFFDTDNQPLAVVIKNVRLKMFEPKIANDSGAIFDFEGNKIATLDGSIDYTSSAGLGKGRHIAHSWILNEDVDAGIGFTIRPDKDSGFFVLSVEVEVMNLAAQFVTPPPIVTPEGAPYQYQPTIKDEDLESVTLALQEGPEGMIFDKETKNLSWTPGYEAEGVYPVKLIAIDGEGNVSEQAYELEVTNSNRLPLFTSHPVLKGKETVPYEYVLTALDKDFDEVFLKLIQAPKGMTFNSETNTLNWLPDYYAAGEHEIKIGASDVYDEAIQTYKLVIEDTNRLPTFNNKPVGEIAEGQVYQHQVAASDPDEDILVYRLLYGPKTMTIDKATGLVSWNPDYVQAGDHEVAFQIDDGKKGKITQAFTLEVDNVNRAPKFTSAALATTKENSIYRYQLLATDADLQGLKFSLERGPRGMEFDKKLNTLTWQPDFDEAGEHEIEVSVTDGQVEAIQKFKIKVDHVNRPPTLNALKAVKLDEGEAIEVRAKAADEDDHKMTYSLTQAPEGMKIDPQNGNLTWVPNSYQSGEHQIWLKATDQEGADVLTSFDIKVNNVNRLPIIDSDPISSVSENEPYYYHFNAYDDDEDVLSYRVAKGPKGLVINASSGYVSWKPDFESAGQHPVSLIVSDGFSDVTQSFVIQVKSTNRLPTFTSKPLLTGVESEPYQYPLSAIDPDNHPLTFELVSGPQGMTLAEGPKVTWTPDWQQGGFHPVVVRVVDSESGGEEQSFIVEVKNKNRAPKFTSKAVTEVVENRLYRYQATVADDDGDRLKVKLVKGAQGMTLDPYAHTLSWRPGFRSAGNYDVVLSVSDGKKTAEQKFTLQVADNNRAPKVNSVAPTQVKENALYEYDMAASDLDSDVLKFRINEGPEGMTIDESTGRVSWKTGFTDAGRHGVELEADDGKGQKVTQAYTLLVTNVNRKPIIKSKPDTELVLGAPFRYKVETRDLDWDNVDVKVKALPKGAKFDKSNHTIHWPKDSITQGKHNFVIEAMDGESTISQSFTLNVRTPTAIETPQKQP